MFTTVLSYQGEVRRLALEGSICPWTGPNLKLSASMERYPWGLMGSILKALTGTSSTPVLPTWPASKAFISHWTISLRGMESLTITSQITPSFVLEVSGCCKIGTNHSYLSKT